MARRLKLFFAVILPWCGLVGLGGYEAYSAWLARHRTALIRPRLARFRTETMDGPKFLGQSDSGIFKVAAYTDYQGDEEGLYVLARDRHLFRLSLAKSELLPPGSLFVSIYSRDMQRFVDVGARFGQDFPGYLVYYPQAGPDAGKFVYVDYDLDGELEKRKEG